jgi:REP element-mobilizing transposase RayT
LAAIHAGGRANRDEVIGVPQRGNVFAKGHFYHIYNRGAGRAPIFFNDQNFDYCLDLVAQYRHAYGASIIAYCLMPNHYHFLLRQVTDVPLSKFVGVVFNAYVQAVNKQQERKGTLFADRFKHVWVDRDEYLIHLCRYIHLNPVLAHLVLRPDEWPFSSYREWTGQRLEVLCDERFMQEFLPIVGTYQAFVEDYLHEQHVLDNLKPYLLD